MASERPPGVASSATSKTLARTGLAGRSTVRKAGPRPCNLPSMKRSTINVSNNVEIVPSGSTGWAKTPKPSPAENVAASVPNTWTVPPRVVADRPSSAKQPASTRSSDATKKLDPDPAEAKAIEPAPASSSTIDNPFGVDINVTSWAREVSPPPPSKRAWSDASPMDFSKPIVFDQTPAPAAVRHTGPLPDNAWRPAVVRKPTISSILKKPDPDIQQSKPSPGPEKHQSESNTVPAHPQKQVETEPAVHVEPQKPALVVDEAMQAMVMKQKAHEAAKRRQEEERRLEEESKARVAEKLAALDQKKASNSKQPHGPVPISVMQRPKDAEGTQPVVADSKSSETSVRKSIQKSKATAPSASVHASEQAARDPLIAAKPAAASVAAQHRPESARRASDARERPAPDVPERTEEQKPPHSGRRSRHSHRRHQEVPGSRSGGNAWPRRSDSRSDDRDEEQRPTNDKEPNEGEKAEPVSPANNVPVKESTRRHDRHRRMPKTVSRSQEPASLPPPSSESVPDQKGAKTATPLNLKKELLPNRKWRQKEPASPPSPLSASPVAEQKDDVLEEKKAPWKSRPPDVLPSSDTDKKRQPRRKRFSRAFENAPVVGSEAGTLMWSAAAPVMATISLSSVVPPPRAWSTPKSNSLNAELLNQQQNRSKSSPGAGLAKRALAETLASRSR